MTTWTLAGAFDYCGCCGVSIGKDRPMLKIALKGVTAVRMRCETCAKPYGAPNGVELEAERLKAEERSERAALADTRTVARREPRAPAGKVLGFARFADVVDAKVLRLGKDA